MPAARTNRRQLAPLALLLLAALWLLWPDAIAAPLPADSGGEPGPPVPPPAIAAQPVSAVEQRTELGDELPATAPEADLAHPYAYSLQLHLVDPCGLPVPGALAFAAPRLCGLAVWPEPSDARGELRLEWNGRARTMQLQLAIMAFGVLQPLRLLELEADRPQQSWLVMHGREQAEEVQERLRTRDRRQLAEDSMRVRRGRLRRHDDLDVLCGRTLLLFREFDCTACHTPSRIAGYQTLARCGDLVAGLHPAARFHDLRSGELTDAERQARQRQLDRSTRAEQRPQERTARASVVGKVLGADGEPAAFVPVAWLGSDGALRRRVTTDSSGRYVLGSVAPGLIDLVAGGADGGTARTSLVAINDVEVDWNCQLQQSGSVRGTARDEGGGVLVGWHVEFESLIGDWADLAPTRADGSFAMTGVPGPGTCLLWPDEGDLRLPVLFGVAATPDGAPLQLDLDRDRPTRARLRLRIALPPDCEWARIDARIAQLDTGRMAQVPALGHEEAFEIQGLAPGPYRVEVGAAVLGWVDCGVVTVDGRGLWDLGTVHMPAPAAVKLRLLPGATSPLRAEHALYRRTAAVDVHEAYRLRDADTLLVGGGEHVLVWRGAEGLRSVVFTAGSGGETEVVIGP